MLAAHHAPFVITVHPRARGEHGHVAYEAFWKRGSSPRTRGTWCLLQYRRSHTRFIPAHAGNISDESDDRTIPTVHPRARGEHAGRFNPVVRHGGSSPRTRGTLSPLFTRKRFLRFIPAHAGNIPSRRLGHTHDAVHPRARGEHFPSVFSLAKYSGSSPRTRGTLSRLIRQRWIRRFIPAHAGNISGIRIETVLHSVHPRARGEHNGTTEWRPYRLGSSPRTRGTFKRTARSLSAQRFIPAHAGNIFLVRPLSTMLSVHPRARGEHARGRNGNWCHCGSSPRTRGTLVESESKRFSTRFIPAHAGNMIFRSGGRNLFSVHPRARGEHQTR